MPIRGTPVLHVARPSGAAEDVAGSVGRTPGADSRAGVRRTPTHCPYCSLLCGMELVQSPGLPLSVAGRDFPTNRGGMCRKGWSAAALLERLDRLAGPLVRDRSGGGGVEPDDLLGVGRSAFEVLDAMGRDGGVRALLVMGSNRWSQLQIALGSRSALPALTFSWFATFSCRRPPSAPMPCCRRQSGPRRAGR